MSPCECVMPGPGLPWPRMSLFAESRRASLQSLLLSAQGATLVFAITLRLINWFSILLSTFRSTVMEFVTKCLCYFIKWSQHKLSLEPRLTKEISSSRHRACGSWGQCAVELQPKLKMDYICWLFLTKLPDSHSQNVIAQARQMLLEFVR